MESWVQSRRPRTNASYVFSIPSVQNTAPATKKFGQVIRSAAPVAQNHLSKPEDLMLQSATFLKKSTPWPPNISDEHASCTAPATRHASLRILFKCPTSANFFWNGYKTLTLCSLWPRCRIPYACHTKQHLNVQKCSEPFIFLHFWLRNVLRATTPCTFSTSHSSPKSAPTLVRFFLLRNVLRATTTCTFSTSQFLKVLRSWRALYILNSKCASHHNGVQFFISHLVRWLRTRRCSEPTLRPSGATNHAKNTVHRDFSLHTCILFLLTLSLLWSSLFFSSLLWLFPPLLFPSVHIVGSLTSKFLLETMKFLAELSWIIQTRPGTYPLGLPDNAATTREKNAGSRKNANVNLLFAKNGHLQMKEFRSTAVHPKSSKFPYIIIQNIWIYIYIIIYIKLDRYIFYIIKYIYIYIMYLYIAHTHKFTNVFTCACTFAPI